MSNLQEFIHLALPDIHKLWIVILYYPDISKICMCGQDIFRRILLLSLGSQSLEGRFISWLVQNNYKNKLVTAIHFAIMLYMNPVLWNWSCFTIARWRIVEKVEKESDWKMLCTKKQKLARFVHFSLHEAPLFQLSSNLNFTYTNQAQQYKHWQVKGMTLIIFSLQK